MKNKLIATIAILALIACAKSEDKKNPMAPVQAKTDSKALQDAKKAAQDKDKGAEAAAKDGNQGAANTNATSNANGAKSADATPIPTQQKAQSDNTATAGTTPKTSDTAPKTATEATASVVTTPTDSTATSNDPATADSSANADDKSQANASYDGEILKLIIPHKGNWGWIKIEGDDAKKLFETLQLKSTVGSGNQKWNPAMIKKGTNVTCFEQAQKVTPNAKEYTCSLYVDYKEGRINLIADKILDDKTVPELKEDYVGKYIYMSAKGPKKFAEIRFEGADAKKLYETLSVEGKKSEKEFEKYLPDTTKDGADISCIEEIPKAAPDKSEYKCLTYISFDKGATLRAK